MSSDYPPPGLVPKQPSQPSPRASTRMTRKLRPGMSRKEAVRAYHAIAQELAAAEEKIADLEARLKAVQAEAS